jgi:hypothetical protein
MTATLTPQERDALLSRFEDLGEDGPLGVLTNRRFVELAGVTCDDGPVVSLYLDLSPQHRHNDAWEISFKTMARVALAGSKAGPDADAVRTEIARMERWIREVAPRMGRGAALFSCPARDLWWSISLPVALPNRLRIGRRPYLRPLARVRDEHDRFAVVLLDNHRARLFLSQLGAIEEVADILEETAGQNNEGSRSRLRFRRSRDAHVMWHAGAVAQATEMIVDRFEARHLLVCGSPQVLAEYRPALPPHVSRRWAGEFAVAVDASASEITAAIAPVQQRVEAREEAETIQRLENWISTGRGVWGLAAVLGRLEERRVMTLVVHDRYRAAGGECLNCEMLLVAGVAECPACGGPVEAVEDIVDAALERAVVQEAGLELVRSGEGRALLPAAEPIGALLRF